MTDTDQTTRPYHVDYHILYPGGKDGTEAHPSSEAPFIGYSILSATDIAENTAYSRPMVAKREKLLFESLDSYLPREGPSIIVNETFFPGGVVAYTYHGRHGQTTEPRTGQPTIDPSKALQAFVAEMRLKSTDRVNDPRSADSDKMSGGISQRQLYLKKKANGKVECPRSKWASMDLGQLPESTDSRSTHTSPTSSASCGSVNAGDSKPWWEILHAEIQSNRFE